MAAAFRPRPNEDYLSVNWLEYFRAPDLSAAVVMVREAFVSIVSAQMGGSPCLAWGLPRPQSIWERVRSCGSKAYRFLTTRPILVFSATPQTTWPSRSSSKRNWALGAYTLEWTDRRGVRGDVWARSLPFC